ncbi:type II toxin-antitoxin system VapC family toxin [Candidatus Micrarchaeota archaeon]|nr:type II toxin-antitoxin system VapC family toxin [Candidatus Micrarchaeota archaeon]MBU2476917.1 type II toxin-antitoxin system VapC family toxin [Candidatus Micrarchaeota archaeon]
MTSDFLIDSFAWIEYFRGTKEGEKVKRLLENFRCFTPTVVIAELSDKYSRENYSFWSQDLQFISENSVLLNLDMQTASEAGKIKQLVRKKYKNKFGLVDAIILATAKKMNAKVVTGDKHFKPLENVEFL